MNISGQHRIAAPRQAVWDALNDAQVLKASIPGCQELRWLSPAELEATILAQLGPVKAVFQARITLTNLNPPTSYTIAGEGKSGAAGFGRGEAQVALSDQAGATLLQYTAEFKLGGKIAQLGSRLIEGATRKLAEDFFARFALQLDRPAAAAAAPPAIPRFRLSRVTAAGALGAIAAALLWWLVHGY